MKRTMFTFQEYIHKKEIYIHTESQRDNHLECHMYECEGDLHDQLTTATYAKLAMKSRPATTPNTKH